MLLLGGPDETAFSDAEINGLLEHEKEISIIVKMIPRPGGAFYPFLNNIIYDLSKYGVFKTVDRNNYKHTCLQFALQAGGLPYIKLQELVINIKKQGYS